MTEVTIELTEAQETRVRHYLNAGDPIRPTEAITRTMAQLVRNALPEPHPMPRGSIVRHAADGEGDETLVVFHAYTDTAGEHWVRLVSEDGTPRLARTRYYVLVTP